MPKLGLWDLPSDDWTFLRECSEYYLENNFEDFLDFETDDLLFNDLLCLCIGAETGLFEEFLRTSFLDFFPLRDNSKSIFYFSLDI